MRVLTVALCAALLPQWVQANELMRVYRKAIDNDAQVLAAAKARDAALESRPQARGVLLPQVSADGQYSYQKDTLTPAATGNEVSRSGEPYDMTLSLTQVIYNKSLFDRLSAAGTDVAAAETTYLSAQQSLTLRVAEAYFNLLAGADALRFSTAENKAVERQLEQAKQRFDVGLSAITDVQEAQARYDLTVAQKIEAEQRLASAKEALAEITGSSDTAVTPLRDDIPLNRPEPAAVEPWLKAASESNLDVVAAQIRAERADKDVDINAAGHYPTLSLTGSTSLGEQAGFNEGEYESDAVTLRLNVPIFAGGTTQSRVRAAHRTHEQRLAELEGARRAAERRTRDAYLGVIAGISRVSAFKQAVLSNTTALEASEVGLQVGTRTAVDVLNAQRELYGAQRDYARARYDYLLSVLRLKLAAGRLREQDLDEIDRLLTTAAEAGTAS